MKGTLLALGHDQQLLLGTFSSFTFSFLAEVNFFPHREKQRDWRQKVTSSCDGLCVYRESYVCAMTFKCWSDWITTKRDRHVRCGEIFVQK